jgi:alcohol dehydrogenase class IV
MKETGMPNGVGAIGYAERDLDALTERSVAQKRLLDNAPAPVGRAEIKELFRDALRYW